MLSCLAEKCQIYSTNIFFPKSGGFNGSLPVKDEALFGKIVMMINCKKSCNRLFKLRLSSYWFKLLLELAIYIVFN